MRRGRSFGQGGGVPERRAVEIAAATVDEAVRLALQQLGLNEDQVEIEILEDPAIHDVEEALVRVSPRSAQSAPVHRQAAPAPISAPTPVPAPVENRAPVVRRETEATEQASRTPVDLTIVSAVAQEVTEDLVDLMGLQATVHPLELSHVDPDEPPTVGVEIVGPDLGVLIGRRGDVLQQFQYLVTLLVNRRVGNFNRVVVDVGGYKQRREEYLMAFADRMAERVASSRRPLPLEAMPANERRVVHLALRDDPRVYTESQGEGESRKIVIYPRQ